MVKNILKDSFLALLKLLAKVEMLKHKKATIIGITGSSGKTSCKDMVVAFLKPHYKKRLKFTKKGNSETGIPYEILNIPVRHYKIWEYGFVLLDGLLHVLFNHRKYDIFVIEYGIDGPDKPNNMEYLLSIVKPHIAILLSVSTVHGENFEKVINESVPESKKIEAIHMAIAQEKFKLLQAVKNKKLAYLTKDVTKFLKPEQYENMTVLNDSDSEVLTNWENTAEGISFTLATTKGALSTTIPGVVMTYSSKQNVLFASLVTMNLKKDLRPSLSKIVNNFHINPGRSSLLPGADGITIIDSSYNANPYAAKELFPLVKEVAKKGRRKKIIVLGDFRELGSRTPEIYRTIVKEAAKVADILILTNEKLREYGIPAAVEAGFTVNENLYWFQNGRQLSFHIHEVVEKNSVVLFEGSQNTVFLEYAVQELCENKDPKFAEKNIPRMTRDWLDIK
ncbi:hypothetical protein IT418_02480 [bacterium]|nr:hypothetical protein [bacterium]